MLWLTGLWVEPDTTVICWHVEMIDSCTTLIDRHVDMIGSWLAAASECGESRDSCPAVTDVLLKWLTAVLPDRLVVMIGGCHAAVSVWWCELSSVEWHVTDSSAMCLHRSTCRRLRPTSSARSCTSLRCCWRTRVRSRIWTSNICRDTSWYTATPLLHQHTMVHHGTSWYTMVHHHTTASWEAQPSSVHHGTPCYTTTPLLHGRLSLHQYTFSRHGYHISFHFDLLMPYSNVSVHQITLKRTKLFFVESQIREYILLYWI